MCDRDRRLGLPPGNMFRYYSPEKPVHIPEGCFGELTVKTASDFEAERKLSRG